MPTPVLLPWADENNTGSSNTKQRVRTIALTNVTVAEADGAIRPEERINATVYTAADSKRHLLKKNIGATEFDSISMMLKTTTIHPPFIQSKMTFNLFNKIMMKRDFSLFNSRRTRASCLSNQT